MNNNPPKVSVVMIFLNEEKYLQSAITSVLEQTFSDWEILLVDDGSTDESTAIAKCFASKYPNQIHYLEHDQHQNRGMSASRNLGIQNATGKYLGFLDADDLWLPKKLAEQVAILEEHPMAALVCGRTQWWYSWTGKKEDADRDFYQNYNIPLNTLAEGAEVLSHVSKR